VRLRKLWPWLRAVALWLFSVAILLVWNHGFHLFYPDTWEGYRNGHYNKSAFSLVVLAGVTYWLVWMTRKKKAGG